MSIVHLVVDNIDVGTIPEADNYDMMTHEILDQLQEEDPDLEQILVIYTDRDDTPVAVATLESSSHTETNEQTWNQGVKIIEFNDEPIRTAYVITDPTTYAHVDEHLQTMISPEIPLSMNFLTSQEWDKHFHDSMAQLEDLSYELQDLIHNTSD